VRHFICCLVSLFEGLGGCARAPAPSVGERAAGEGDSPGFVCRRPPQAVSQYIQDFVDVLGRCRVEWAFLKSTFGEKSTLLRK
jgi:hypothetical protein